jgi:ABC-type glycerol-3-phosphate transport system permease component
MAVQAYPPWVVVARYAAMAVIALLLMLPLLWMFGASFRPDDEIFKYATRFGLHTLVPETFTLKNYAAIFQSDFRIALRNSLFVSLSTVVLGVLVNSLAGFAFAVFEFPFKRVLFIAVLATFMMPFESIVIPLFVLIRAIGWTDSYRALILPEVANGLVIFLFRQFSAGIPKEIIEAARTDGATWLQIYARIVMPISGPTVATAALMLFILQWDAFFWPLVAASAPDYVVIQVAIARNVSFEQTDWGQMFASASVAVLIAMVPFLGFQRFYVRTIMQSGLK